jgi:tRNA dimethylallyltransferase
LARRLNAEIVNADSMQVYRHMDIGTAKPSIEERAAVPHHLIDIVDPDQPFDAAAYAEAASRVISRLHQDGKTPLVVGGTGLYMKVLVHGICEAVPTNETIRFELVREEADKGLASLHAELSRVDPVLAGRIHPNDRQRTLRALEVYRASGRPLSEWQDRHRFEKPLYPAVKIFLSRDREELYARIDRRVEIMMEAGFLAEVEQLLRMGYGPDLKPMQSLGYRQLVQHLSGELSLDEAIEQIKRETRRYAKRQMTWFRGDPEFRWFDAENEEGAIKWALEGSAGN